MKKFLSMTMIAALLLLFVSACDEEGETITIDSSQPQGEFTVQESGTFVMDNAPTSGSVELGTDETGKQFLHLGSDFQTNVATGTVAIYLSTSDTFTPDPGNGNPELQLVGSINENGEAYLAVSPMAASKFTHVIAWCTSASVQFGNAALQ